MNEIKKIKKAFFEEGLSRNQIVKKFHRSWETVNRIVDTPLEDLEEREETFTCSNRKATVGTLSVIEEVKTLLLHEKEERIKKKQRFTAKVIYNQLVELRIYSGSYRRMQEIVRQARVSLGQADQKSYLPLHFPLGSALQVDHGEVDCVIGGARLLCYLFIASVPGTTIRYCQIFGSKSRESWGEFHERAFNAFGGIFHKIVYDNDSVLISNLENKIQTEFSVYLVEHYKFLTHFCNPASGNEKGNVENSVGYCRRNYLPGRPVFALFEGANKELEERFIEDVSKGKNHRTGESAEETLKKIRENLQPLLPSKQWCRHDKRQVNSYQQVEVEGHFYSVPERYVGTRIRVHIRPFSIRILAEEEVIDHERQFAPGADSLFWCHYLKQLQRKPGALWDCKATQGLLEDPLLENFWLSLLKNLDLREARAEFINVLFFRKKYDEIQWREAIKKTIACGFTESAAVEAMIKMQLQPKREFEGKAVQEKLPHLLIQKVECDLHEYADLYGRAPC